MHDDVVGALAEVVVEVAHGLTNGFVVDAGLLRPAQALMIVAHDWLQVEHSLLLSKVAANGTSTLAPGAR